MQREIAWAAIDGAAGFSGSLDRTVRPILSKVTLRANGPAPGIPVGPPLTGLLTVAGKAA